MKAHPNELPNGKNSPLNIFKKFLLSFLTLTLLAIIPLYLHKNPPSPFPPSSDFNSKSPVLSSNQTTKSEISLKKCDIFRGDWVRTDKAPYYTNETNCVIDDRQNCMKFGRPDTEFMRWGWKPEDCELPRFDAKEFLEIVRGKTLAFVGDSVGRNQMQSLVCILATVAIPVDVSYKPDTRFRRWLYNSYNFTIIALWSPLLVKAEDSDPDGLSPVSLMHLYLDEADEAWARQVGNADIVIISAGQWFFRPFVYYEKGQIVGCFKCNKNNVTELTNYYGYRMALRTSFRALLSFGKSKGAIILRTFSPAHFENADWDKGGNCPRKRPFRREEMKLDGFNLEFYLTQVEEFREAEKGGGEKGLRFELLDVTEAMVRRGDAHPNHYGHWANESKGIADCVHWCMPGPVDTWNELLLQVLKFKKDGYN